MRYALLGLSRATALLIFVSLLVLHLAAPDFAARTFWMLGVSWGQEPFYDVFSPLSWLECHQYGFDVYRTNPCDTRLSLSMSYPPGWLAFSAIGIDTTHTGAVGITIGLLFGAAVLLLPRPSSPAAAIALALALGSNAVLFGLYQANFDLAVFTVAILFIHALQRSIAVRKAGYVAVAGLAALKIYPVFLLLLAAREPLPWMMMLAAVFALAAAAHIHAWTPEFMLILGWVPRGRPLEMFGLGNSWQGLRIILGLQQAPPWLVACTLAAFLAVTATIALRTAKLLAREGADRHLTLLECRFLAAGAAVVVGCFLTSQSWRYKAIFLICTITPLVTLALRARLPAVRATFAATVPAILLALWAVFLINVAKRADMALGLQEVAGIGLLRSLVWLAVEAAWWWIIGVFGGCLAWLMLRERAMRDLLRALNGIRRGTVAWPGTALGLRLPRHSARGRAGSRPDPQ